MNLRIITLAAAGALSLAACSDQNDATETDAAADAAANASAMAPADGTMAPADGTMAPADGAMTGSTSTPGTMDGTSTAPGQTPPTLPEDTSMTSPTTSPPAQ